MGILKRVIVSPAVYLRFLEFLHVDIQSTGCTLSRPRSRQPNDVMSEIECTQLHSVLFRRRHNTRQSHGMFALAKHLSISTMIRSKRLPLREKGGSISNSHLFPWSLPYMLQYYSN